MPDFDPSERVRVKDKDTGYVRTVHAGELPHGNYQVLKQDAVDAGGVDLPPEFPGADSAPSSSTPKES